jgi:hypothetical protein
MLADVRNLSSPSYLCQRKLPVNLIIAVEKILAEDGHPWQD